MYALLWGALTKFSLWVFPKIAAFFGIYVLSDTVTKPIFVWLQQQVLQSVGSANGQYAQAFELLGVNDFMAIIFSSYALALSLKAGKAATGAK